MKSPVRPAVAGVGLFVLAVGLYSWFTAPAAGHHATKAEPVTRKGAVRATKVGDCTVTGTVTAGGKPVVAGRLVFHYKTGPVALPTPIQSDGKYLAVQLPPGPARVALILDPTAPLTGPGGRGRPKSPGADAGDEPPDPEDLVVPPTTRPAPRGRPRPSGLPPAFANHLREFAVPPECEAAYKALHAKYSQPSNDSPVVEVRPGANTFDITLP